MPANKDQWIADLASGKYPKCQGKLKNVDGGFCCLGVLLASQGPGFEDTFGGVGFTARYTDENVKLASGEDLSDAGRRHFGLSKWMDDQLVEINDRTDDFSEVIVFLKTHDLDAEDTTTVFDPDEDD